ncbi:MAG TPA: tRNA pseudouridine(13) synthase TruD [Polyangiaceae bacterium]
MNQDPIANSALAPHEPRRISTVAPVGGRLGPEPEDFAVDEIPLYQPSGTGEHLYVRIQKRGLATPDLTRIVGKAARVRERDIGYAGLKDKHAITSQWLSLPKQALPPEEWELPDSIQVLEASWHGNKLRTGHLTGNRFGITLVDVPEADAARAGSLIEGLRRSGLPNYFGEQRFGIEGKNLPQALEWLRRPPAPRRKQSRFHEKLFPSVLQAEVFNRYLSARYELGFDRLVQGEVVRLAGSGSVFVVENPEQEQPRLESADLVLTGPIFGPRAVAARDRAAELEAEALAPLGLDEAQLDRLGKSARGTRRDAWLPLDDLSFEPLDATSFRVSFTLPAGSYATQLVRELTGGAWLTLRARPQSA